MKTARELLIAFIDASWSDPETMLGLFAQDGAIEMPYLATFGYPERYTAPEGITSLCNFLQSLYPGFRFENLKILIDTPDQVFAEYEFTAVSTTTGRKIHQLIFGRVVAENGRIKLVREALNAVELARAVYPQGMPDLFPEDHREN